MSEMTLMRINITEQRAQLGLNITRSNLNIANPRAEIQLNQQPSQIQIDKEYPSFSIDGQRLRNETGLASTGVLAGNFAAQGRQAAMQGIARWANEGDLMASHQIAGSDPIPVIARNASMARLGPIEINIGLMPQSIPELEWDTGYVNINFTNHDIRVNSDGTNTAQITLHPRHAVSAYLETPPHINITSVPMYM